jgi:uncharacterized C2H2 Zn-finger protein
MSEQFSQLRREVGFVNQHNISFQNDSWNPFPFENDRASTSSSPDSLSPAEFDESWGTIHIAAENRRLNSKTSRIGATEKSSVSAPSDACGYPVLHSDGTEEDFPEYKSQRLDVAYDESAYLPPNNWYAVSRNDGCYRPNRIIYDSTVERAPRISGASQSTSHYPTPAADQNSVNGNRERMNFQARDPMTAEFYALAASQLASRYGNRNQHLPSHSGGFKITQSSSKYKEYNDAAVSASSFAFEDFYPTSEPHHHRFYHDLDQGEPLLQTSSTSHYDDFQIGHFSISSPDRDSQHHKYSRTSYLSSQVPAYGSSAPPDFLNDSFDKPNNSGKLGNKHGSVCPICGKVLKTDSHVQRHVQQVHRGEPRFFCSQCGKGFKRNENLKCHLRVHSGEKPFECVLCQKRFKFQSGFNSHMKKLHGI